MGSCVQSVVSKIVALENQISPRSNITTKISVFGCSKQCVLSVSPLGADAFVLTNSRCSRVLDRHHRDCFLAENCFSACRIVNCSTQD